MQKTEILPGFSLQFVPIRSNGFEERESADDIGLDKSFGTPDRPVDMALGGKMYHSSGPVASKQLTDEDRVSDITLDEDMALISGERSQIFHIPRIIEYVQIDHAFLGMRQPVQNEICPDEPSSPRH